MSSSSNEDCQLTIRQLMAEKDRLVMEKDEIVNSKDRLWREMHQMLQDKNERIEELFAKCTNVDNPTHEGAENQALREEVCRLQNGHHYLEKALGEALETDEENSDVNTETDSLSAPAEDPFDRVIESEKCSLMRAAGGSKVPKKQLAGDGRRRPRGGRKTRAKEGYDKHWNGADDGDDDDDEDIPLNSLKSGGRGSGDELKKEDREGNPSTGPFSAHSPETTAAAVRQLHTAASPDALPEDVECIVVQSQYGPPTSVTLLPVIASSSHTQHTYAKLSLLAPGLLRSILELLKVLGNEFKFATFSREGRNGCIERLLRSKSGTCWSVAQPGCFVCKTCFNTRRPCMRSVGAHKWLLLPLAPSVRDPGATWKDEAYYIHQDVKTSLSFPDVWGLSRSAASRRETKAASARRIGSTEQ